MYGTAVGALTATVATQSVAHHVGDRPGGGVEAVGTSLARSAGEAEQLLFEHGVLPTWET